jgi:hypothetical protein
LSVTGPLPDFSSSSATRKRVLWKWSLVVTGVIFLALLWQCGTGLLAGRRMGAVAVQRFHDQLNAEAYNEIYAQGDDGFRAAATKPDLVKFLAAVHRKLGNAGSTSLRGLNVNVSTGGTFVTGSYETQFARGLAIETFVSVKAGSGLKLHGYNVNSNLLITD